MAPAPAAPLQTYLVTAGTIYANGTVATEPFYQMTHAAGLSDDPGTGPYNLQLRTAADQPIFTRYFDLHRPPCHHACDESHGFFAETVPYTTTAATIVIRQDNTVLKTIDVSPHTPTVTLLSPNGGEQWGQSTLQTMAWTVGDTDPNTTLYYNVLFSHDDGANWIPVATLITQTTVSLHATLFPGTEQGRFRIIATDGVNTAFDDSDAAFSIEHKPPEAEIVHPAPDQTFRVGVPVVLSASAYDLEDGNLSGSQMIWRSDGIVVGTGTNLIWSHVPGGSHTVTLTVTDSEENTSMVTVNINVTGVVFLPLVLH